MKVTKRKLSPTATAGVGAGITLVVALFGWFVLISPQRSHASSLDAEIVLVEQQVSEARAAQMQSSGAQPIRSADLFRLTKAMPSDTDIAGVMLELSRVAAETGIVFEAIKPQATAAAGANRAQLIDLTFTGNFYSLSDFLYRLRNLVSVQKGRLLANGRLFAVEKLSFGESPSGFPSIRGRPHGERVPLRQRPGRGCRAAGRGGADLDDDRYDRDDDGRDAACDARGGRPVMAKKVDLKAKAKRQKMIAAGGGVLLIAVLAFQVPRTMKMMSAAPPPPAPAAVAPGTTVPSDPSVLPTPGTVGGGASPTASGDGTLVDSDPEPVAADGQLISFGRFKSKDPFAEQIDETQAGRRGGGGGGGSTPTPSSSGATPAGGVVRSPRRQARPLSREAP